MVCIFNLNPEKHLPIGTGWATERITISTHNGTHMDAPWHFASIQDREIGQKKAMTIDELPLKWCIGPLIVLDCTNYEDGYVLTPKDIDQKLEEQLLPVKDKAEKLIVTIDSLLQNLQYVFDKETMNSLKESVENLERSSDNVKEMLAANSKLRLMIGHIESITRNLSENNEAISEAIQNFSSVSDSLAQSNLKSTVEKTNLTLEQTHILLKKINDGEGTLGMLVNNDTLYRHLEDVSRDLDKLLIDLKENPKKYINVSVFGGKSDRN